MHQVNVENQLFDEDKIVLGVFTEGVSVIPNDVIVTQIMGHNFMDD